MKRICEQVKPIPLVVLAVTLPLSLASAHGPQGGMDTGQMMGAGMMDSPMMGSGMMMGPGTMGGPRTVDTNSNGIVEPDEAASAAERAFSMLDHDGNGAISGAEHNQHVAGPSGEQLAAMKQHWQTMMGEDLTQQMVDRMRQHMTERREIHETRFREMDTDGDGKVTKREFLQASEKAYQALDGDADGKVSVWEYRAGRRSQEMR